MKTGRIEAFSDGVLAIIITIMVLELKAPEEVSLKALLPELPVLLSYVLSFVYVGIYWNNHHHLFQVTERVNGKILWANLHLMFWLSLIPFTTSWIGEHHLTDAPVALYGINLIMASMAYNILQYVIIKEHGSEFVLKKALGTFNKEKLSMAIYIIGLVLSHILPWAAMCCFVIVAIIWLIPDKRIENSQKEAVE